MFPDALTTLQRTDSSGRSRWITLLEPCGTLEATQLADVIPALEEIQKARGTGLHAVGSISYEASPAFDPHLETHSLSQGVPYLRFSLFKRFREGIPKLASGPCALRNLTPSLKSADFESQVRQVQGAIADGETYQVNLTYPWEMEVAGDPRTLFRRIRMAQAAQHQAYLEEEDRIVISASPERFFRLENGRIQCRPMKGTGRPGDESPLRESVKNRAENVMIVDMIRNDLGRVADPGTVQVEDLFRIEPYPSLVQMTSAVTARGPEDPLLWLHALFPCASITGAPKCNTMKWIHALEPAPRNLYTGCIGGFYADGVTEFNVAIRTLCLDRGTGKGRYGTGCGIVWDSDPQAEYQESVLKTAVLTHPTPEVHLIETMRGEARTGIRNLPRHMDRLLTSAAALGYETDAEEIQLQLQNAGNVPPGPRRCRLTLSPTGDLDIQSTPLPDTEEPMTFRVDTVSTPSTHPELQHKTSRRVIYDQARARHPDVQETLLINERGECMEFCIGNLLMERDGHWYTPSRSCGLLAGTARAETVEDGAEECIITPQDLGQADAIYLINAVRGRVRMNLIPPSG